MSAYDIFMLSLLGILSVAAFCAYWQDEHGRWPWQRRMTFDEAIAELHKLMAQR